MADVLLQATGGFGAVLGQIGLNVGGAAVAGGIVGWAAKKVLKIVAVLVGLEFGLLAFLQQRGFITVNWDQLGSSLSGLSASAASVPSWLPTVASLGVGGGFLAGALVGFKRG